MKEKHGAPPLVGGSSLLVIFAVLCLTVFALLSLSTVRADERLGDASAQAVVQYYQADREAERILAQMRAGYLPPGVREARPTLYTYSCSISDTQELRVIVRLEEGTYQVLRWQMVSTTQWEPEDSLTVWDGRMD